MKKKKSIDKSLAKDRVELQHNEIQHLEGEFKNYKALHTVMKQKR